MYILVGGAWPYANGPLHIGHLAALLPGDVIARYHRAIGNDVFYVSGSDCHGTPVTIRAGQEGKTPSAISDFYHESFVSIFDKLGFSYDRYGKTSSPEHIAFVEHFHRALYEGPHIDERETPQAYCPHCHTHLVDRQVVGLCPHCNTPTRAEQCDLCGEILDAAQIIQPACATCASVPQFRNEKHLYLRISQLEPALRDFIDSRPHWRKNAVAFSNRYLQEGLRDRAITRTLSWGIDVPHPGYAGKKVYIWAENVLGYLSMSTALTREKGLDVKALWENPEARHYYVHGKDNIPFHTIILPSLLLAHRDVWHLPDDIISSEFMTLEGKRVSTSRNWAIWLQDIVDRYDPDALRYYMIANGPEKRDADFSWRTFYHSNNAELLGAYGNFVNRTLAFIQRYNDGIVPAGIPNHAMLTALDALFTQTGNLLAKGQCKDALAGIFAFVHESNRYFDAQTPWTTRKTDAERCGATLYTCVQLIAGLSTLLQPFLPFSSGKLHHWLSVDACWKAQCVPAGYRLTQTEVLFERLHPSIVDDELARLMRQANPTEV